MLGSMGYGAMNQRMTGGEFPPGMLQMPAPGTMEELLQKQMACVAANTQAQRQAQEMMQAEMVSVMMNTQAMMQHQMVEKQAALMQWMRMNGQGQEAIQEAMNACYVPVALPPPCGMPQQQIDMAVPLGMTMRLAAAGIGVPQQEQQANTKPARVGAKGNSKGEPGHAKGNSKGAPSAASEGNGDSMRSYLADLRNEDPKSVFITRRIKGLGFWSKELLIEHFSKYGKVKQVLIPHTKVKPFRDAEIRARSRPGNFGLVVMNSQAVVQRIFAEGSEHTINGVTIEVQVFQLPVQARERQNQADSESQSTVYATSEASSPEHVNRQTKEGSSDDKEVGESRSGGCSDEQPSSYNGGAGQEIVKGGEAESSIGNDALMSVGEWRRQRSQEAPANPQTTATPQNPETVADTVADNTPAIPSPQASGEEAVLPLQSVLGVIGKLSRDPRKMDLADDMSEAIATLMSGPEQPGQVETCQMHLAQSLRMAASRLLAEADTLKAAAVPPPVPKKEPKALPLPLLQDTNGSTLATALATELSRLMHQGNCGTSPAGPAFDQPCQVGWAGRAEQDSQRQMLDHAQMSLARLTAQYNQQNLTAPPGLAPPPGLLTPNVKFAEPLPVYKANSDTVSVTTEDARAQPWTLKSHLKEVNSGNQACIFVARKIQTLGFHAHKKLREHYSQYGEVTRVLIANRKLKGIADSHGRIGLPRTRPGSLGLIVMKSEASVRKILAGGEDQHVAGHLIRVEEFEPSKAGDLADYTTTDGDASTTAESCTNSHGSRYTTSPGNDIDNKFGGSRQTSLEMAIPESGAVFIDVPGF